MSRWLYVTVALSVAACQGGDKDKGKGKGEEADSKKVVSGANGDPGPIAMPTDDTPTAELVANIASYDRVSLDEVRRATESCRALGKRADASSMSAVLGVASKVLEPTDTGNAVRQACVRALGAFRGPKVVEALLSIARADANAQPMLIHGAAIEALGQIGDDSVVAPIIEAMVHNPQLGDNARVALASLGDAAVEPLIANLRSPPADGAPGTVKFHSARILGDLRATAAVPALLASLAEDPEPAMFSRSGEMGPSHHVAVIEALQKVGGEDCAEPLHAYWNRMTDDSLRVLAMDAYGWVTRSGAAHGELAKMLTDTAAAGPVRMAAGLALTRTTYTEAQLAAVKTAAARALAAKDEEKQWFRQYAGLIARAYPGVACKQDAACYQGLLVDTDENLTAAALGYIPSPDEVGDTDRGVLHAIVRERALLELAKLGRDSATAIDAILEVAKSGDRLVRLAALRALVAAAERPCSKCSDALTAIADATPAGAVPRQVVIDTDAAASYFRAR